MPRPSKPWILPVTCATLVVIWVLWLAYEREPPLSVSSIQPPPTQATPKAGPAERTDKDSTGSPTRIRETTPPSTSATTKPPTATAPPLQLVFQAPPSARVGENFDVRVAISARQPVGRIVVEVAYDPKILRMRGREEIDSSLRATGDLEFESIESREGHGELLLRGRDGPLQLPVTAPLAQFEALAPGFAEVRIANVDASGPSDRSLQWLATGRESQIIIY